MSDKPSLATIDPNEVRRRESHRAHLRQAQAAADLVEEVKALRQIIHQQEQRLAAAEARLIKSEEDSRRSSRWRTFWNVVYAILTLLITLVTNWPAELIAWISTW